MTYVKLAEIKRNTDWDGVQDAWDMSNCVSDFWGMLSYNLIRFQTREVESWVEAREHPNERVLH